MAQLLDAIEWEQVTVSFSTAICRFPIEEVFAIDPMVPDGKCFFRAMAKFMFNSDEEWLLVKRACVEFARQHWDRFLEFTRNYQRANDYERDIMRDDYWGGSLESDILSELYNVTIHFWVTDDHLWIHHVQRWGLEAPHISINLLFNQNHFDLLNLRGFDEEQDALPIIPLEDKAALAMDSVVTDEKDISEPSFLRDIEQNGTSAFKRSLDLELMEMASMKEKLLTSKGNVRTAKAINLDELKEKDCRKAIKEEKTIPLKVGKILNYLFSIQLEGINENDLLILFPRDFNHPRQGAFSITDLGHKILDGEKEFARSIGELALVVSGELMTYLNSSYLLRMCFPGSGLSQTPDLLHPSLKVDAAILACSVLICTFLYKSSNDVKRKFLRLACAHLGINTNKLFKEMINYCCIDLYESPYKIVQHLSTIFLRKRVTEVAEYLRKMSPQSKLALQCIDLESCTLKQYYSLLKELSERDMNDVDFNSTEIKDLHECIELVMKITEAGRPDEEIKSEVKKYCSVVSNKKRLEKGSSKDLVGLCIIAFFTRKMIFKFMSLQGKAYSGASLGNLLAYAHNLYLSKDSLNLNSEDLNQLDIEIRRLNTLMSEDVKKPVALICMELEHKFNKLFDKLPVDCKSECETLFTDIRNAESHSSAWRSALRLKGTAYEGLFAKYHNWTYVPEDLKPSLGMAIQTLFPEKFEMFLERTHLHPEFRDFIPDFFLYKPRVIKQDTFNELKVEKSVVHSKEDATVEDDASTAKLSKKKRFPLPEVGVQETLSTYNVYKSFEKKGKEKNKPILTKTTDEQETVNQFTNEVCLMAVEVGYQTDVEGKVISDMKKWDSIIRLMKHIGINFSVVACADSTNTPKTDWWIPEDYVQLLLSSISHLFKELQENSPVDVTDIAVGNISTQKVRSVLRSGAIVKTPVTFKELHETWKVLRCHIIERPTGAKLDSVATDALETALVEGAVLTRDSAEDVLEHVVSNMDRIIGEVSKTKFKHEINKDQRTAYKLMMGWLNEDLLGARCNECLTRIRDNVSKIISEREIVSYLCTELQPSTRECCQVEGKTYEVSSFQRRVPDLNNINHKALDLNPSDAFNNHQNILDSLVTLTLPGKTEKERKIKRGVEQLIRAIMKHSNLPAIKLPSGHLLLDYGLNKPIYDEDATNKSFKKGGLKTVEEDTEHFKKLLSETKLKTYSEHTKQTINKAINSLDKCYDAKCAVNPQWVKNVLFDLKSDTSDEVIIHKIQETYQQKKEFSPKTNRKYRTVSWSKIEEYLNSKREQHGSMTNPIFGLDCILFKEVVHEVMRRMANTPYQSCISYITELLKLLLTFQWYQELVYYSKTCETFLQSCSEFHRSGIKILRIRHTDTNLVIALPANKKQNMRCCIYSKNFTLIKGPFMLNRRQAVLGAAYCYIVPICFIQCLQHYRCVSELETLDQNISKDLFRRTEQLHELLMELLESCYNGSLDSAQKKLLGFCKNSGNFLNRGTRDQFICCFAGLSVTFSTLLGDSLLNNSQPFNKQIQMMRFGMLSAISRLSCPQELGKKFSSSCRKVEFHVARLYMQLIVFCANYNVERNCENWLKTDLCSRAEIPCFSIFGMFVNSDRQLIFDIYLVHIYNKEMDDFDEGCIKVLEETAERHAAWELSLKRNLEQCKQLKKLNADKAESGVKLPNKDELLKEAKLSQRRVRLLLGLPNIKKMTETLSDSRDLAESESLSISSKSSSSASYTSKASRSSVKSARSFSSRRTPPTSMYGIRASKQKPMSIESGFVITRDDKRDYQQAITDRGMFHEYKANKDSVLKDVITVIRENPNHTFGSFELIQACTEVARTKYPPEAIDKAKRDPRNWVSVSEVTETTSIIAEPRDFIFIKDAYRIIIGSENKKMVKLLRGKFQRLGMSCKSEGHDKIHCQELLSTIHSLTDKQKDDIIKGLINPSKLTFYNWQELMKKGVNEVLLTNDGNYIFCWLKSLSQMVKSGLKSEIKNLKYGPLLSKAKLTANSKVLTSDEHSTVRDFLEFLKSCTKGEVVDELNNTNICIGTLILAWVKFVKATKFSEQIIRDGLQSMINLKGKLTKINADYEVLINLKKELPGISFSKEEILLRQSEKMLLVSNDKDIMCLSNMLFLICLCCPWCIQYKTFEAIMMRNMAEAEGFNLPKSGTTIGELHPDSVINHLVREASVPLNMDDISLCTKYCMCLFSINELPFASALNSNEALTYHSPNDQLMSRVKHIMAITGLRDSRSDFKWTINLLANSNFEVTKKLTGRNVGERLPRSVRSKVIYEVVKLVDNTEMAILQQLSFTYILDVNHRFFAVLAPKAQLGGHRDLLVQETGTKMIHATTEMFSRTLLSTTKDDGLTNSHLKETILNSGLEAINTMKLNHGKETFPKSDQYQFYKVCCISGDNTKWGPIHCCSLFSGMMQQLLKDVNDWSSYYKLTFLKNLCRQVEIPASSIKKILNSFKYKNSDVKVDELSEEELREKLFERLETWDDNEIIKFLVANYISKGKMALNSYNHMGQGIHHATSSILTSIMSFIIELIIRRYYKKHLPDLEVAVTSAGSSDDYAKCIITYGVLSKTLFDHYEDTYWEHMCRLKNLIAGFSRACQMKDSAKTLVSDCFFEFYSEFMMSQRITPAVIKFILTGLINSSVTSPLSLVQACHVSSQQAMYNSVPLVTNLAFTLFRQQMFYNHTEYFVRSYGHITLGSLSSFGRLYIPKYSNLIGSSVALEDAEEISKSANVLLKANIHFPEMIGESPPSSGDTEDSLSDLNQETDTNSEETSSMGSGPSESSAASFHFSLKRSLNSTEEDYLKCLDQCLSKDYLDNIARHLNLIYQDQSDYEPENYYFKVLNSGCVLNNPYLADEVRSPEVVLMLVRSLLNVLISGYYRTFSSEGTEKSVKASLNRDENRIIEDPMIQLLPEKLRRELARLGLAKMEASELIQHPGPSDSLSSLVAHKLITMNCATEEYKAEVMRLKQTLTSRNVLHGLAGGIKELSLPIYTIFMKSYFFKDTVFLEHYDRWNTKHSQNYRDSTGQQLTGKVVVKFTTWLEKFLNSQVTFDNTQNALFDSLFDENLKFVEIIRFDDGKVNLCYLTSELRILETEMKSLAMQFSEVNRQKIKVLESSSPENILEAHKAVITKSKLYSASDSVRLINNAAIVVGNLLDEGALMSAKPSKIDMGNLGRDRFKLSQFYSSLVELVNEINNLSEALKKEKKLINLESVNKYANNLTLLCRLVQQARSKITSFYMLKGSTTTNEPTVAELVSYGIIEGKYVELKDVGTDTSAYSLKYWKVLQCISAISVLPISDSNKTSLLNSFLSWKPSKLEFEDSCPLSKKEKRILEEFDGKTLIDLLASELPSIKDDTQRNNLEDIVDFVRSPLALLRKKPYIGVTATFQTWGDGQKDGRFTYSSSTGEASGIFISTKLHLYISKEKQALLLEVEKKVLAWLNKRRTDVVSQEQHHYFIDLLCDFKHIPKKATDGRIRGVRPSKVEPKFLDFFTPRGEDKVIKVKEGLLTVRKCGIKDILSEPRLVWGMNSLTIVYDEQINKASYHENILSIRELLDKALNVEKKTLPPAVYSDSKIVLSRTKFSSDLFLNSLLLLHHFLEHTPSSAIWESQTKSEIIRFINSGVGKGSLRSIALSLSKSTFNMVTKDIVIEGAEEEKLCQALTNAFEKGNTEVNAWPEVQSYLEEKGLQNITLEFLQRGLSDSYSWQFKNTLVKSGPSRLGGFRGLVSAVGAESLPRFLAPLIANGKLLSKVLACFTQARNYLSRSGLTDLELDGVVCSVIFCLQQKPKIRKEHTFSPTTLLHMSATRSFKSLPERYSITFNVVDDEVVVICKVNTVKSSEGQLSKNKRVHLTRARLLTFYNRLFPPVSKFEQMVKEMSSMYPEQATSEGEFFGIQINAKKSEECSLAGLWELCCPGCQWRKSDMSIVESVVSILLGSEDSTGFGELETVIPIESEGIQQVTFADLLNEEQINDEDVFMDSKYESGDVTFDWDD
ncbi:RNA-dependent RNA polymerase [Gossas virus]|uniref:RNA-directed RNA polymerase L n=1 Tax=Gossas virus TaxID=1714376 RepID=A0A0M5KTS8_9VIRU|nr:RNA-dependent RNA polymerase [Gossas virus]ALD83626.1 RNA-dependent RNA polymerase [Gossas virus]